MSRNRHAVVAIVGVGAIVASLGGAGTGFGGVRATAAHGCPTAQDPGPFAPEAVLRAARRQVPSAYANLTDRGRKVRLNPRNYQVVSLVALGARPFSAGVSRYRRVALARCSVAVVDRSWAVALNLSAVQLPGSMRFAFFVKTRSGWKLWYHS